MRTWRASAAIALVAIGPPDLASTLVRLSRVAELYRDTALGFACEEKIVYSGERSGHIQFAYLFIRDESGRLRDFRTWKTGTTVAERGQEVHPSDYHVPLFLESAYLWAFVFRSDRQPLFRFTRLDDDNVLGRAAVKIGFEPRGPIRKGLNDWAGVAWIDGTTTQILKVEAYTPADWNNKRKREAELASAAARAPGWEGDTYVIERIVTEFGVEKNGLRLPSHVEITRSRSMVLGGEGNDRLRERVLQRIDQSYARFQFYSARTGEEINRFVDGEGPLPTETPNLSPSPSVYSHRW